MSDIMKISIIIPVYNMANYLDETVQSWLVQKMQEIEIIYVNDASTDSSLERLRKWEKRDKRIIVIDLPENSGPWSARIEGVRHATGEYIMFADADDSISPNACEVLYCLIKKYAVDILHFSTKVVNVNNVSPKSIIAVEDFVKPYTRKLSGEHVLTACFAEDKYRFSLWNKIYSADICKKALSDLECEYMCMAEDKLAYFIIAYYAKSYIGVRTKVSYNYYYGRGGFGKSGVSVDTFERFCSGGLAADRLGMFLAEQGVSEEYKDIEKKFRKELLGNCTWRWVEEVREDEKAKCFDLMVKYFRADEVSASLIEYGYKDTLAFAQPLKNAKSLNFDRREIKTIGTFYYSIVNGGLERVLCSLARIWIGMGYKVVVITDCDPDKDDYALPESVERIVIPKCTIDSVDCYAERAGKLYQVVKDQKIDVFVYHAWVSKCILWDEIVIKAAGAAFVPHCHSVFGMLFKLNWPEMDNVLSSYILSDGIVTLSEMDKNFWLHFNDNVWKVNNPFFENVDSWVVSNCDNHNIVWVGRFSEEKNPLDAVDIFDLVHDSFPDAKLSIVGTGDRRFENRLKQSIRKRGLEDAITLEGFHKDVKPFYQSASIFLLTSEYEGFSLVLQESMLAGLPTVMYELPYLSIVQNNPAISEVKMHDIRGAADAIIDLLRDENKRKEKGLSGRSYIEQLSCYDYESIWESIIESTTNEHEDSKPIEKLMMQHIVTNHDEFARKNVLGSKYSYRKTVKAAYAIVRLKDAYTERGIKFLLKKACFKIKERFRQ